MVNIAYPFPKGGALLSQFSLPIARPYVAVLFGPSGSGKSTLLHCLAGIEKPQRGVIRYGGESWFDSEKEVFVPPQKRSLGLLFQEYSLFPHLTVSQNITYGLRRCSQPERTDVAKRWVKRFKLGGKEERYPDELSGGERQRVGLAQTLASKPRLLLLDEPFSALDLQTRSHLRGELRAWVREQGILTLFVTHDLADALSLGDELIIMSEGSLLQRGSPLEIVSRPVSPAVAKMIGVENLQPGRVLEVSGEVATLEVGKGKVIAVASVVPGQACFVSIRAEEVILEKGRSLRSSARNRLIGFVQEWIPIGSQVRVIVDCGFPLTALVTRQAIEELALHPGEEVTVVMKASSIHVIPAG